MCGRAVTNTAFALGRTTTPVRGSTCGAPSSSSSLSSSPPMPSTVSTSAATSSPNGVSSTSTPDSSSPSPPLPCVSPVASARSFSDADDDPGCAATCSVFVSMSETISTPPTVLHAQSACAQMDVTWSRTVVAPGCETTSGSRPPTSRRNGPPRVTWRSATDADTPAYSASRASPSHSAPGSTDAARAAGALPTGASGRSATAPTDSAPGSTTAGGTGAAASARTSAPSLVPSAGPTGSSTVAQAVQKPAAAHTEIHRLTALLLPNAAHLSRSFSLHSFRSHVVAIERWALGTVMRELSFFPSAARYGRRLKTL